MKEVTVKMGKFDFSGWATRNDLLCGDGRTIRKNAFKDNDGQTVPLVWNHQHSNPDNVLGHALLENREDGVYAYCTFNDTEAGQNAKQLVQHGDVRSLSIYANRLKQVGGDVIHGTIRELSLVLAGANPGAFIDTVMAHGDGGDEGVIAGYDENIMIYHSDESEKKEEKEEKKEVADESKKPEEKKPEAGEKTIEEIFNSMTEEQKTAAWALIGMALNKNEDSGEEDDKKNGGNEEMKHNLFDSDTEPTNVLSHSDMAQIFARGKQLGSLKDAAQEFLDNNDLAHGDYGIDQIDVLFPEAKSLNTPPEFIQKDMDWVQKVMNKTHHTPFSRIKSMFADITEDEARAKGYIKGKLKKEEVFSLLKRTTTPQTIYKKQKIDRDDVVDITDFDVIAWLKAEMRMMLNEEIARAVLVGDGRLTSSDDHIKEDNIRPIWKDADLYTIKYPIAITKDTTAAEKAAAFIEACVRSRIEYKGSGNPKLFAPESIITECLLLKDKNGRIIYDNIEKLATACRVSKIVSVPVMAGLTRVDSTYTLALQGIIVNLQDYNIGADKGGAINMFDDFDIDYNAQKYLIETRISGALIKPLSAIAIETKIPTADLSNASSGSGVGGY